MSDQTSMAKRLRIKQRLEAKLPVWFKRPSYNGTYSTSPRWHQIAQIETLEEYPSGAVALERWHAVCGYTWDVRPWIDYLPDTRETVKTKKLRCSKCDRVADKEQG